MGFLLSVGSSLGVVFGLVFSEFLFLRVFGDYSRSGFPQFLELVLTVVGVSFVFEFSGFVSGFLFVLLVFSGSFVVSVVVKLFLLLFFRRSLVEDSLFRKSNVVQLVRSLRVEGVSKHRIKRVFDRVGVDVSDVLKFFK